MSLCKFREAFGQPGKGFHTHLGGIAILDALGTIVAAKLISAQFELSFSKTLLGLFVTSIALHRVFCVNTTVNKALFGVV